MSNAKHVVKISEHPRAVVQIRRAKAMGGLGALILVAILSLRAGVPPFETGLRALASGLGGYVVAWAVAVHVWRHLAVAELQAARRAAIARRHGAGA